MTLKNFPEERFTVRKRIRGRFRVALVYPNSYRVAMSNLGTKIIYHMLNSHEKIYCERFVDGSVRSLETGSPIQEFDLIMFCYQYELDIFNIARYVLREKLHGKLKLVGGPCVHNPLPLKGLTDYIYLGEAESSIMDFVEMVMGGADPGELANVEGILDLEALRPKRKAHPNPLNTFLPPQQVSSKLSVFGDAMLVDVSRGCRWACKFCFGRYVYSPYRERPLDQLIDIVSEGLKSGNYDSLVLISSDLNSYSKLDEALDFIESMLNRGRKFRLIAPSLRPDTLNERLIDVLVKSGEKTITLAPESSEEIRARIGKCFTDEQLIDACKFLRRCGIRKVKLYFMIGLPEEELEDLRSIVRLVTHLKNMGLKLRCGVNPFVPKPHTPFEDVEFQDPKNLRAKLQFLRKELGPMLVTDGIKQAILQSIIARGDEYVGRLIQEIVKLSDGLSLSLLKRKAGEMGIDLKGYLKHGSQEKPWKTLRYQILN